MPTPENLRHQWDHGSPGSAIRVCTACGKRETYWDDDEYPNDPCPTALQNMAMRAAVADLESETVYGLSNLANSTFGNDAGPGAQFLTAIRDGVLEALDYVDETDWHHVAVGDTNMTPGYFMDDAVHQVADTAVPWRTFDVWATFSDMMAYREDPTELGADASDMEQCAKVCLYLIGTRLATALFEQAGETYRTKYESLTDED